MISYRHSTNFLLALFVFLAKILASCSEGASNFRRLEFKTNEVELKFVNESFVELYKKGKGAYLENNWSKCARLIERSVEVFNRIQGIQSHCRKSCKTNSIELSEVNNMEDLFFSNTVARALCILKCKALYQEKHVDVSTHDELTEFRERQPYNYLQNCYYKKGDVTSAASAALTYLEANPDNKMAKQTFDFYLLEPSLRDLASVKSFEEKTHEDLFLRGVDAYEQQKDDQVVTYMELALKYFLEEEEECRVLCEGAFDQGWYPDFISSVANHYTYSLKCKQQCPVGLSRIKGEMKEDFLPMLYNYLQFSSYKAGNIHDACTAVESFLLFKPEDSEMLDNKIFYRDQPGVKKDWFQPRPEALEYYKRDKYEEAVLRYIEKEFS